MNNVDIIKSDLIEKIRMINNKDILVALDTLVSTNQFRQRENALTPEQMEMLEMSELDIDNDRLIAQDDLDNRNLAWLNEM
ncbi:MAG: hypothetical protein Kapaf2KO_02910 [Candidatus Kapaibacteriales bacterium]